MGNTIQQKGLSVDQDEWVWGIFFQGRDLHVIPCIFDNKGWEVPVYPHKVDCFCPCIPEILETEDGNGVIFSHNIIH
jgi:hypothetical protein